MTSGKTRAADAVYGGEAEWSMAAAKKRDDG